MNEKMIELPELATTGNTTGIVGCLASTILAGLTTIILAGFS